MSCRGSATRAGPVHHPHDTTTIPYFKEVIIMSNACDVCGYRNGELKPGGGFSDQGVVITLQVLHPPPTVGSGQL